MKKYIWFSIMLTFLLTIVSCKRIPLNGANSSSPISILYSSNVNGEIEPCG